MTRAERTAPLSARQLDHAAVSFALERERALSRSDHSASVRRLRRALSIGLCVWLASGLLDVFVTQFAGEGDVKVFFWCTTAGSLILMAVLWRLRRQPEPSVVALWACDIFAFTSVATCVSVDAIAYRGLVSPYAPAIIVVLLARGATTLAPWQHGAWLFAAPALAQRGQSTASQIFTYLTRATANGPSVAR